MQVQGTSYSLRLAGLPPARPGVSASALFLIREAQMSETTTDERGSALWVVLQCCGGHESIWTAPVGEEGDRRVLRFTSHDLWCTAGQAMLDTGSTL